MSTRAIWEATGKGLINRNLAPDVLAAANKCRFAVFDESTNWNQLVEKEPWLKTEVCIYKMFPIIASPSEFFSTRYFICVTLKAHFFKIKSQVDFLAKRLSKL